MKNYSTENYSIVEYFVCDWILSVGKNYLIIYILISSLDLGYTLSFYYLVIGLCCTFIKYSYLDFTTSNGSTESQQMTPAIPPATVEVTFVMGVA